MTPHNPDDDDRADRFITRPGQMSVTLPPTQAAELERRRRRRRRGAKKITGLELAKLRQAAHLSQVELGQRLGMTQTAVSRLERQDDLLASTLVTYLEAIEGHVELVAGDERIRLSNPSPSTPMSRPSPPASPR